MKLDWTTTQSHGTSKLNSGASNAKQLVPVQLDIPIFWKSDYETCVPSWLISNHVTGLCLLKESVIYLKSNIVNCRGIVFNDSIKIWFASR